MSKAYIAVNATYGGFSLSSKAIKLGRTISGNKDWHYYDLCRHDPVLVAVIRRLGKDANGSCADIELREVPKGTRYYIHEYDGAERVVTFEEQKWETAT